MAKTRMITVGGYRVGLMGLDEVFREFYERERVADESLKAELLEKAKIDNYTPESAEEEYADALLKEYIKFCRQTEERHRGRVKNRSTSRTTWQGIPREEIPWFPTIHEELCNGCKVCLDFCPYDVFKWDEDRNKPIVMNPFNCVVGCSICAPRCKLGAITFPPLSILKTFKARGS